MSHVPAREIVQMPSILERGPRVRTIQVMNDVWQRFPILGLTSLGNDVHYVAAENVLSMYYAVQRQK
jgi:hypothetical protein